MSQAAPLATCKIAVQFYWKLYSLVDRLFFIISLQYLFVKQALLPNHHFVLENVNQIKKIRLSLYMLTSQWYKWCKLTYK